jgi:hypothetical protein
MLPRRSGAVSLIFNERQKLLANNFDRMSTAYFTVGIATPLAGYLYNIRNFANAVRLAELLPVAAGWTIAAVLLHIIARKALRGLIGQHLQHEGLEDAVPLRPCLPRFGSIAIERSRVVECHANRSFIAFRTDEGTNQRPYPLRRRSGDITEDRAEHLGGLSPFVALEPEEDRRLVRTLTPAFSATRAVVKRCAPSFAKT